MTKKDLLKLEERSMRIARAFYISQPFTTKVYMAIKTKLTMTFIHKNWEEIIK